MLVYSVKEKDESMDGNGIATTISVIALLLFLILVVFSIRMMSTRSADKAAKTPSRTIPPKDRPDELTIAIPHSEPVQEPSKEDLEETLLHGEMSRNQKEQLHRDINAFLRENDTPE